MIMNALGKEEIILEIYLYSVLFREANICEGCWVFMGIAILVLQKALEGMLSQIKL